MKQRQSWQRRICVLGTSGLLLCLVSSLPAADLTDLVDGNVRQIAGDFQFTEGPAWHPEGYLLFSDIPSERILRCDADGNVSTWMDESGGANGLMCDQSGNVYACQGAAQQIARLQAQGQTGKLVDVLVRTFDGKPFNRPNDLALDAHAGLYFTDPLYGPGEPNQPVQGVYYIDAQGQTHRVIDDLPRPNGVLVSPDGMALIVANPNLSQIVRYEIRKPGELGSGKVLFTGDAELDGNGPDGMAFDRDGNLYATYKSLVVLGPGGELVGRVEVPEKPSNCAFGGQDLRTLYITARTGLYALPTRVAGLPLAAAGPGVVLTNTGTEAGTVPTAEETREVKAGGLTLQVPESWKEEPVTSQLRLAQFVVPAAEGDNENAAYVVFPPFGGTASANIQRWLGQFAAADRRVRMSQGQSEQGDYIVVDITGTYNKTVGPPILRKTEEKPDYRVLNVMFSAKPGGNYFFKIEGPQKTVAAQTEAFRQTFGGSSQGESEYTPSE